MNTYYDPSYMNKKIEYFLNTGLIQGLYSTLIASENHVCCSAGLKALLKILECCGSKSMKSKIIEADKVIIIISKLITTTSSSLKKDLIQFISQMITINFDIITEMMY